MLHKGILGQQFGGATVKEDTTLGDYIARKQRQDAFDSVANERKLTFDKWYEQNQPPRFWTTGDFVNYLRLVWQAAQDNNFSETKKLKFHEWYPLNKNKINFNYDSAYIVWAAAQENV